MMTILSKPISCPGCHYKLDTATALGDNSSPPEKGDRTICVNCGTILEFTSPCQMQIMPESKFIEIKRQGNNPLLLIQRMIRQPGADGFGLH